MRQLSGAAREVQQALRQLLPSQRATIIAQEVVRLAARTTDAIPAAAPERRAKAQAALKRGVAEKLSAKAGGRIKIVRGHRAIVGQISVKGQQLDTLLSAGSFNKNREEQADYASQLGYRIATRDEHWAYLDSLLGKEDDGSINAAESKALNIYRKWYVRDTAGGLAVDGRHPFPDDWRGRDVVGHAALFVCDSAQSKKLDRRSRRLRLAEG